MRVKGVQLFFQPPGFFQDFRFSESEIPALRVPDVCDEPHVFRRLFGRYFCQIFDLRAFRPVLVQLIHFSFCVSLRAWKWPFWPDVLFSSFLERLWSLLVRFSVFSARIRAFLVRIRAFLVRNRRDGYTKRTSRFRSCKSVRTTGNPGNQSLRSFRTDTGRLWS